MFEMSKERMEWYSAELRALEKRLKKWRRIAVALAALLVILTTVLFVRVNNLETSFEAARQNHIAELRRNLVGFDAIMWDIGSIDTGDATERLRRENAALMAATRALMHHHDFRIGTIAADRWWVWQGLSLVRADAPEVLHANQVDVILIIRRLQDDLRENPAMDSYDVLQLVIAARDSINEFFYEHDIEADRRYHIEAVLLHLSMLWFGAHRASVYGDLIFHDFVTISTFRAGLFLSESALYRLYTHYGEEFTYGRFHVLGPSFFDESPTLIELIYEHDDNPAETAGQIAEKLLELVENIDFDMDLWQISDLISETMNEIQEMYQVLRLAEYDAQMY